MLTDACFQRPSALPQCSLPTTSAVRPARHALPTSFRCSRWSESTTGQVGLGRWLFPSASHRRRVTRLKGVKNDADGGGNAGTTTTTSAPEISPPSQKQLDRISASSSSSSSPMVKRRVPLQAASREISTDNGGVRSTTARGGKDEVTTRQSSDVKRSRAKASHQQTKTKGEEVGRMMSNAAPEDEDAAGDVDVDVDDDNTAFRSAATAAGAAPAKKELSVMPATTSSTVTQVCLSRARPFPTE